MVSRWLRGGFVDGLVVFVDDGGPGHDPILSK
jgi:hypothetical protein